MGGVKFNIELDLCMIRKKNHAKLQKNKHVRNTHVQKFTQSTFFRSFFYVNYPQGVNFST